MRSTLERSRYAQIALSYTKPLPMRLWAAITAAYVAWIFVLGEGNFGAEMAVLLLGGSFVAWFGAMVAAHAKEQLADPRAKLTPGYRGPRLLVAAIIFTAGVIGLTAMIVARWHAIQDLPGNYDLWLPGYLALVLVITTLLAWMGQLQTPAAIFVIMAAFTPVLFDEGRQFLSHVARGQAPTAAMVLLGIAIAALIALWWRMAVMHEEMPEYNRLMSGGFRLRVRMTGDPVFRRENAADTGRLESFVRRAKQLDKIDSIANASFRRRARHWRIVIGLGRTSFFVAIILALMMVGQLSWAMRDRAMRFGYPAILCAMVPGLIVAAVWPRRWYVLADESLRPASRKQFIREQGTAMALEFAETWAWITALTFAAGFLMTNRWDMSQTLRKMLMALPILAGGQFLIFGIIVWILRYRAGWLVIVPMFLALIAAGAVLTIAGLTVEHTGGGFGEAIFISLAIAGIGLLITFDAYRRWLVTEFD